MNALSLWVRRRRWTLGLAVFFIGWYLLQLGVFQLYGEDVARWWFYFERPLSTGSPGMVLAPLSHDMLRFAHLGANLLLLAVAGGLVEPYIGKNRVLLLVIGVGYLGIYLANATALFHQRWMLAGASSGIFALWAYAGLQMRPLATEFDGLAWSSVEKAGALALLIGIPVFLVHQTLLIDPPHGAHIIGLVLGCLYFGVEFYLSHTKNATNAIGS